MQIVQSINPRLNRHMIGYMQGNGPILLHSSLYDQINRLPVCGFQPSRHMQKQGQGLNPFLMVSTNSSQINLAELVKR